MFWHRYIYGAHWRYHGKEYYDEFPANSSDDAAEYFNHHKRDDVTLVWLEKVGPIAARKDTRKDEFRPSTN